MPKRSLFLTANLLFIVIISGCATIDVKGRAWKLPQNHLDYPELEPGLMPTRIQSAIQNNKETLGLVFSGGGTRSATLTLGQLRALHELNILDEVQYISAVSGGSWASLPFIYHPNSESEKFLGKYLPPNELTLEYLKAHNSELGKAITEARVFFSFWKSVFTLKGDKIFASILNDIFLEPFDLNQKKFFTLNEATAKSITDDNNSNYLNSKQDLYYANHDKPFLIVGGTVQAKHKGTKLVSKSEDIYPLDITPLYIGIPTKTEALARQKNKIGGGFIEPFLYDSLAPNKPFEFSQQRTNQLTLEDSSNIFTLSDVIAISGAAPQALISGALGKLLQLNDIGLPEFHHWPISSSLPEYMDYHQLEDELEHGDGGNIDNIGIMPLLARKVSNLIVFINTQEDFNYGYSNSNQIPKYALYSDLQDYFRFDPKRAKNQVFEEHKLKELYRGFERKKISGEPLVYCDRYQVKSNSHFAVEPYKANICWYYNDLAENWLKQVLAKESSLEHEEKQKIFLKKPPYDHIPHSRTFGEEFGQIIDRRAKHVNIESNISSWSVCQSYFEVLAFFKIKIPEPKNNTKCSIIKS